MESLIQPLATFSMQLAMLKRKSIKFTMDSAKKPLKLMRTRNEVLKESAKHATPNLSTLSVDQTDRPMPMIVSLIKPTASKAVMSSLLLMVLATSKASLRMILTMMTMTQMTKLRINQSMKLAKRKMMGQLMILRMIAKKSNVTTLSSIFALTRDLSSTMNAR